MTQTPRESEELHLALDRGEVRPWYQPIVRLTTGELVGFEALARWHRPSGMVELPGAFIGLAEETGLVTRLDLADPRRRRLRPGPVAGAQAGPPDQRELLRPPPRRGRLGGRPARAGHPVRRTPRQRRRRAHRVGAAARPGAGSAAARPAARARVRRVVRRLRDRLVGADPPGGRAGRRDQDRQVLHRATRRSRRRSGARRCSGWRPTSAWPRRSRGSRPRSRRTGPASSAATWPRATSGRSRSPRRTPRPCSPPDS